MEEFSWYIWLTPLAAVPIVMLFAFLGCGARTGPREPEVERIAYEGMASPTDQARQIYSIRTDVSAPPTNITERPGECRAPSWSLNGQQLAFACWQPTGGVWGGVVAQNVGIDGRPAGGQTRLVRAQEPNHFILDVAWGPGNLIAYSDASAIWIIPSTATLGTPPVRRTHVGTFAQHPTWAPDGRIAFTKAFPTGNTFIFIVDAAGNETRLVPGSSGNEREPNWSRNGAAIVFVRDNNLVYFDTFSNTERVIVNDAGQPTFSSDGARIAFVRAGIIWTCEANGANQQPLTPGPSDSKPSWVRTQFS